MIVDNRIRGIDLRLVIVFLLLHSLIPYVSQEGPGAEKYTNDCGPAVASMLIQHYSGAIVTPDYLMDMIGYDRYTTGRDLELWLEPWGIVSETISLPSIDEVIAKAPTIILVNLRVLHGDRYGIHWILVTGEAGNKVRFHDSLYGPDLLMDKKHVQQARANTRFPSIAVIVSDTTGAEMMKYPIVEIGRLME